LAFVLFVKKWLGMASPNNHFAKTKPQVYNTLYQTQMVEYIEV